VRILITGANGQLGLCLQDELKKEKITFTALSSSDLDISNKELTEKVVSEHQPTVIINAAAYTQVDKAEDEPEKAYAVNCIGAKNLALSAKNNDAVLLHVSTDYVFDGESTTPYKETDNTNPQSIYGSTKLQGEIAIAETTDRHIILRTAWVFSEYGNNFVKTMLRLGKERDKLSVVNDQIGCPTYAGDIANALIQLAQLATQKQSQKEFWGLYHYCGDETMSWFDFANTIFNTTKKHGTSNKNLAVKAIPSSSYPTPVKRPAYSGLNCSKINQKINQELNLKESVSKIIGKL